MSSFKSTGVVLMKINIYCCVEMAPSLQPMHRKQSIWEEDYPYIMLTFTECGAVLGMCFIMDVKEEGRQQEVRSPVNIKVSVCYSDLKEPCTDVQITQRIVSQPLYHKLIGDKDLSGHSRLCVFLTFALKPFSIIICTCIFGCFWCLTVMWHTKKWLIKSLRSEII